MLKNALNQLTIMRLQLILISMFIIFYKIIGACWVKVRGFLTTFII